jgi:hypothetical protein
MVWSPVMVLPLADVWLGRVLSLPVIHQIARWLYRFADLLYACNRWQGRW